MLKLSKLADHAVVVLANLHNDAVTTSCGIAASAGIPEPTAAKVLKLLAASGLVESQRGSRGGYRLTRSLASITVCDVVQALDGPISIADRAKSIAGEAKPQSSHVRQWSILDNLIRSALSGVALTEILPNPSRSNPVFSVSSKRKHTACL